MSIQIHKFKEWKVIKESQPQFYILSRNEVGPINAVNRIYDKKTFLMLQSFQVADKNIVFQVRGFSEDLINVDYILIVGLWVEKFGTIPINNIKFNERNHITKF